MSTETPMKQIDTPTRRQNMSGKAQAVTNDKEGREMSVDPQIKEAVLAALAEQHREDELLPQQRMAEGYRQTAERREAEAKKEAERTGGK